MLASRRRQHQRLVALVDLQLRHQRAGAGVDRLAQRQHLGLGRRRVSLMPAARAMPARSTPCLVWVSCMPVSP
jgi:hypothetical protein